jgi:formate dehydrogenase maturation protein FdhE
MPTRTPACPFCESAKTQCIAVEGLSGQVRVSRCNACNKEWNELPSTAGRGDEILQVSPSSKKLDE